MRVTVIGAGVVGVATAYYLSLDGHDVTVVDSNPGPGEGTSFANGGQLSYSFSDALGSPEFVRALPGLVFNRDEGAQVSLSPGLMLWGLRLLRHSSRKQSDRLSLETYRKALHSNELMQALRERTNIEFDYFDSGKMISISGADAIRRADNTIRLKNQYGCDNVILTGWEAAEIEPALKAFSELPDACIYSPGDQVGDARMFAASLSEWLTSNTSCQFIYGESVSRLSTASGRINAAEVPSGSIESDAVVVCAGTGSNALLRPLGLKLPIRGMRGYSVTLPAGEHAPVTSITALAQHFVFSRLGNRVRIAGFADFLNECDDRYIRQRTDDLIRVARAIAPAAADYEADEKHRWSGVRPMTPDSQPIISATAVNGLFINAGHGMLGWTLACASGETLATLVREGAES
ncbi:MAG: FAD-dependent oxidoreductase [Woeseiaceae bacterium]|nr:FAD-dependent oxidoreductase [Woeseiaceae bacterium]